MRFIAKVGIAYEVLRWEEKALADVAKELNLDIDLLHIHSLQLLVGYNGLSTSSSMDVDIVLQRAISHTTALNVTLALESMGLRVINTSNATAMAMNKLWTASILARAGIKIPRTAIAFSEESCYKSAQLLGYPIVVKPIDGSWGRLIAMARDDEELRAILEHRIYIPNPTMKVHMVQEYVKKPGRDIRIFVVGDETPAAIYRISNHWITNTARGGKAVAAKIDAELSELALKTARLIGIEVAGIDVFEDPERGYVVNEINAVPEFKNTVAATGIQLHRNIMEYIKNQVRR
ncbi:MAG: lysine biosynthesis protein LysX [Ignisphaera sp.]|uniref:Lysine biosynthesis protein LysX n=1 Tax=Ignisphaera aggregans TaxID=334771 RepID=A0A7J3I7Y6_9CREN